VHVTPVHQPPSASGGGGGVSQVCFAGFRNDGCGLGANPGFFGGYGRGWGYGGYGRGWGGRGRCGYGYGGFGFGGGLPALVAVPYPVFVGPSYDPNMVISVPATVHTTVVVPLASGGGTVLIDVIRSDHGNSRPLPFVAKRVRAAGPVVPDARPIVNVFFGGQLQAFVKDTATMEELTQLLADENYAIQLQAAAELLARGPEGKARIVEAARSEDAVVRTIGLWGLAQGFPSPEELELIAQGMKDPVTDVRRQAVQLAREMSPTLAASLTDPLLAALGDDDEEVRDFAAEILADRGSSIIPTLLEGLDAENDVAREAASRALIRIGSPAVRPLSGALASDKPHVRFRAAFSLGALGKHAEPAISLLERLAVNDPDTTVRYYAGSALRRLTQ